MRLTLIAAALAVGTFSAAASATTDTLYEGALGSTPDKQGWVYVSFPPSRTRATQSLVDSRTVLDTTAAKSDMAGYFYRRLPPASPLDRSVGFSLMFSLQILEEKHVNPNRAGFSLIVLSSDLKGVELAFWEDQIWAQSDRPLFVRGEGSRPFNTWSRMVDYTLAVQGDAYTLLANDEPILKGALKDYSVFATPPFDFVYRQPDFLFFGDNTGSAAARIAIAAIRVEAPARVVLPPRTTREGPAP